MRANPRNFGSDPGAQWPTWPPDGCTGSDPQSLPDLRLILAMWSQTDKDVVFATLISKTHRIRVGLLGGRQAIRALEERFPVGGSPECAQFTTLPKLDKPQPRGVRDDHRGRGSVSNPSGSLELKLSPGGKRTHERNAIGSLKQEGREIGRASRGGL